MAGARGWKVETNGWLILGFEHAAGRHPDLSPDSADLAPVAEAVAALRRVPRSTAPDRSRAARWARLPAWRRHRDDPPADLDPCAP